MKITTSTTSTFTSNVDVQSDIYLAAKDSDFAPLNYANALRHEYNGSDVKLVYSNGKTNKEITAANVTSDRIDVIDFTRKRIFQSTSAITQAGNPNAYNAITLAKTYAQAGKTVFCAVPAYPSNTDKQIEKITWYLPTSTAVQDMIYAASKIARAIVIYTATEMMQIEQNVYVKLMPPLLITNSLSVMPLGQIFLNKYDDDIYPFSISSGVLDPTVLTMTSNMIQSNFNSAFARECCSVSISRSAYSAISLTGACEQVGLTGAQCKLTGGKTYYIPESRLTQVFGGRVVTDSFMGHTLTSFSSSLPTTTVGSSTSFTATSTYTGGAIITLASDFSLENNQSLDTLKNAIRGTHKWLLLQPTRNTAGAITSGNNITIKSSGSNINTYTDKSLHFSAPVTSNGTYPNATILAARATSTTKYFVTDYLLDDQTRSIECHSSYPDQPFDPVNSHLSQLSIYGKLFQNVSISQIISPECWPIDRSLNIVGTRSENAPKPHRRERR